MATGAHGGCFIAMGMVMHRSHYLLELAKALRRFSGQTEQDACIEKFLHAADAPEHRAREPHKRDFPRRRHIDVSV